MSLLLNVFIFIFFQYTHNTIISFQKIWDSKTRGENRGWEKIKNEQKKDRKRKKQKQKFLRAIKLYTAAIFVFPSTITDF